MPIRAASDESFAWPLRCTCGESYDLVVWLSLRRIGEQRMTALESVELRNCLACGTTMSVSAQHVPSASPSGMAFVCFIEPHEGAFLFRYVIADANRQCFVDHETSSRDQFEAHEHRFWKKVEARSLATFENARRLGWVSVVSPALQRVRMRALLALTRADRAIANERRDLFATAAAEVESALAGFAGHSTTAAETDLVVALAERKNSLRAG